jgi:hypothetical protein
MKTFQLFKGIIGFFIVWLICLAASPLFLAIIGAKYAQEFFAARKINKQLAPLKKVWHFSATTDNNIHSAN